MSVLSSSRPDGATSRAAPASPRPLPPRWRDRRLLLGVCLVAVSVVVGSRWMAAADPRVPVWSLSHELAAGATLAASDLEVRRVAVDAGLDRYLGAQGTGPVGRRLVRAVGAGELLPVAALQVDAGPPRRLVTVPVEPLHAPVDLTRGSRVDLWVTPRDPAGSSTPPPPTRVLQAALVAEVADDPDAFGGATERAVVLDVPADEAEAVVSAVRAGAVDLVRVPVDAP